jgi:hypothetical protein
MLNKNDCNVTAIENPDILLELRPDPFSSLELKIRTNTYPAGRIGGVQATDDEFQAVARSGALTLHGRLDSRVTLTRRDGTIEVTFSGHSLEGEEGGFTVDALEFDKLVEWAIANRAARAK